MTGGTYTQTADDIKRFANETGFRFYGNDSQQREQLREILFRCGVQIKDHGGFDPNEYYLLNEKGEKLRPLSENEAMNTAIHNYIHGIRIS